MVKGKKWLFGCLGGCGALVVLVIIVAGGFIFWLTRPGQLIQPEMLVGEGTTGYAAWEVKLSDPGTEEFVTELVQLTRSRPEDFNFPIPDSLKQALAAMNHRNNKNNLDQMFPFVVAWTARNTGPTEDVHLFTLNPQQMGNQLLLMDWMVGWALGRSDDGVVHRHKGEKIYEVSPRKKDEPFVFFVRSGQVFITSDVGMAKQAIDALEFEATTAIRNNEAMRAALDSLPAGALRGAVVNRNGELQRFWAQIGPASVSDFPVEWSGIRTVAFAGGFVDARNFRIGFDFVCTRPGCEPTGLTEMLGGLERAWSEKLDGLSLAVTPSDNGIHGELSIDDAAKTMGQWINHLRPQTAAP